MKISHSKCETFISCRKKYEYRYVDKLYPLKVGSPLSFGKAFDDAANALLQGKTLEEARKILEECTLKTHAETEYSMVDLDVSLIDNELAKLTQTKQKDYVRNLRDTNPKAFSDAAAQSLLERGYLYLEEYQTIMKRFHTVEAVQKDIRIPNGEGDELQIIVDFVVLMKGEELLKPDVVLGEGLVIDPNKIYKIVLDNKTSNKDYEVDSVRNSDQLTTYNHIIKSDLAGFLVFNKKIKNGVVDYSFFIDAIPKEKEQKVFEKYQDALYNINECTATGFDKNPDACFAFGRKCDYFSLCKYDKMIGLKEPKRKE